MLYYVLKKYFLLNSIQITSNYNIQFYIFLRVLKYDFDPVINSYVISMFSVHLIYIKSK